MFRISKISGFWAIPNSVLYCSVPKVPKYIIQTSSSSSSSAPRLEVPKFQFRSKAPLWQFRSSSSSEPKLKVPTVPFQFQKFKTSSSSSVPKKIFVDTHIYVRPILNENFFRIDFSMFGIYISDQNCFCMDRLGF